MHASSLPRLVPLVRLVTTGLALPLDAKPEAFTPTDRYRCESNRWWSCTNWLTPITPSTWAPIINIHGGAFKVGRTEQGVPLEYLAQGCAVAAINYLLSQHAERSG